MPGAPKPHTLPLPCSWPRRLRSAAVHAIALADVAFTKTLIWAADGLNPRLRLQAEIESGSGGRSPYCAKRSASKMPARSRSSPTAGPTIHLQSAWQSSNFAPPAAGLLPRPPGLSW